MMAFQNNWEQSVEWFRRQPENQEVARLAYFDDPLTEAAERFFLSDEWQATLQHCPHLIGGQVLDVGAGRGIASYALARSGWNVTALEPDSSTLVGAGAIQELTNETGLSINIVQEWGENLPFRDGTFDLIYGRQVLHHAQDLEQLCRETWRVLKPGGTFIAVREHVVKNHKKDLEKFLANHPLHYLYGGENAFTLGEYRKAITDAGFLQLTILKPFSSVINFTAASHQIHEERYRQLLAKLLGQSFSKGLWQWAGFRRLIVITANSILNVVRSGSGAAHSFIARKSL